MCDRLTEWPLKKTPRESEAERRSIRAPAFPTLKNHLATLLKAKRAFRVFNLRYKVSFARLILRFSSIFRNPIWDIRISYFYTFYVGRSSFIGLFRDCCPAVKSQPPSQPARSISQRALGFISLLMPFLAARCQRLSRYVSIIATSVEAWFSSSLPTFHRDRSRARARSRLSAFP